MTITAAIMGATGAVGSEFLRILEERSFPLGELRLLASSRSAGKKLAFKGEELTVEELTHDSFQGVQLVLASAGAKISKEFVPSAVKAGAVVVDNTSYYRMQDGVPLVVPEVNPEDINKHKGIIANPNCSTIIMVLPLWPLHKKWGVERVVVSTYQAASGAGASAMNELIEESKALLENRPFERKVFPHQYAFNLFPHNSSMKENGYCEEEIKMVNETRKMFKAPRFQVTATCVRVPVLRAHSESLNIELKQDVSVGDVYQELGKAEGVEVLENRENNRWPMPIDATSKDPVFVGRVRKDLSRANTVEMWISGDQIRKGAALNAVQIAEKLCF